MGLAIYHTYLESKQETDKKRFLKFAEWFMKNADVDDTLGVRWLTDVSLPQYKNPGPWQSAFSQSRGLSILLRAYQLTEDTKYADMASNALIPFLYPVEKGGVTSNTKWGPYYEEYTSSVPTLVLNGKIFALCGIYDFVRVFPKDERAVTIFNQGINTLINILPEYNLGFWSRYNLCRVDWHPIIDPATIQYQRLHVVQLELLHRITGKSIFKEYADLFNKQDTIWNALKMYKLKYKSLKKIGRL